MSPTAYKPRPLYEREFVLRSLVEHLIKRMGKVECRTEINVRCRPVVWRQNHLFTHTASEIKPQEITHAIQQTILADWILNIDADVRLAPDAVGRALAFARKSKAGLISTFPRQITSSLGEALVVPMIFYLLIGYLPFWSMRRSLSPSTSAACGQFILVRRDAYFDSGGHAEIRDSMHDGVKLPRLFRKAGHKTDLFDGTTLCCVRMYTGLAQTWRGFAKNGYEGLGSFGLLIFLTVLHLTVHIVPWLLLPILLIAGHTGFGLAFAALAVLLQIAQRLMLTTRFEHSAALAPLHPVSILLLTIIQWHSFALHRNSGRSWKGRTMSEHNSEELVVLVDENDNERGIMGKQAAHLNGGSLHRAFSVFVLDAGDRLMLQKRAQGKYHFGGRWTNTCCSHPRPGEKPEEGAMRRLQEEMGLDLSVEFRGSFVYKAFDSGSGLTEHELDHVFVGRTSREPALNPEEAEGWRWITMQDLAQELEESPENFTPWFPLALKELDEFHEVLNRRSRVTHPAH
ncbi:MAG: isopentenyl-diphosphate Delta-isomerase [Phycisphaera sp.]|nr:MAG: isopentenyl-diphosphate Delta-isomerase [Phycisphaera sp.]